MCQLMYIPLVSSGDANALMEVLMADSVVWLHTLGYCLELLCWSSMVGWYLQMHGLLHDVLLELEAR